MSILIQVDSCKECPYFDTQWTRESGCGQDWICTNFKIPGGSPLPRGHGIFSNYRKIAGYVECSNEEPDIPKWCPWKMKRFNQNVHLRKKTRE